jgi:hypothetical protein
MSVQEDDGRAVATVANMDRSLPDVDLIGREPFEHRPAIFENRALTARSACR